MTGHDRSSTSPPTTHPEIESQVTSSGREASKWTEGGFYTPEMSPLQPLRKHLERIV